PGPQTSSWRYGLDTRDLHADAGAVHEEFAARERADREREQHEAAVVLAAADRADAEQQARPDRQPPVAADHIRDPTWRKILAAALRGVADEQAVEARVVATTNQAQPASEAVTPPPRRAPLARPARTTARVKDRSRSRER